MQRKVSNYVISECLRILQKEFDLILVEKKSKSFRTEVYDKFSELVESIIRAQLMNSFASLKNRFLRKRSYLKRLNFNGFYAIRLSS